MSSNNKKNIAHIDWVGAKAGLDNYDFSLMQALGKCGYNTYVCSNFDQKDQYVTVKNVFNNVGDKKFKSALKIFFGFLRAMFYLKGKNVRWIIFNIWRGDKSELFATFVSKMFGFKVLLIIHDAESLDVANDLKLRRFILNKMNDKITTHNQFSLDELSKVWEMAKTQKIELINHGNYDDLVNPNVTAADGFKHFNLDPNTKYLLFFGQIKKAKGVDLILEAMALTKSDYKVIIAGKLRDDVWQTYQDIIDKHGLQDRVIPYIRHLSDEEREFLFKLAYAVVLPYRLVYVSGVVCWAFSFGKATIASDLSPLRDWIDDKENGIIFPAGDYKALAVEMDKVVEGTYDIKAIEKAAVEKSAREFTWDKVGIKYAKVFEEAE